MNCCKLYGEPKRYMFLPVISPNGKVEGMLRVRADLIEAYQALAEVLFGWLP